MFEPYGSRLGAKDKVDFDEFFGSGFRNGSPFEQPYKAFLSAIIGVDLLSDTAAGYLKPANKQIQYTGVWVDKFSITTHEIYRALSSGRSTIDSQLVTNMCQQLVVFCYDKAKTYDDGSTLFHFFRHLRNACAHGNKFKFNNKRTGLPAKWRAAKIDKNLEGHYAILGLVGIPDIIVLLKDIEKQLPPKAFVHDM